ncbi:hypothetical protein ABLV92_06670 [Staphylococcus equorum]
MKINQSKFILYFLIFTLLIFILNIVFYMYSMYIGLDGFDVNMFGGGSDGSFYAQEAINFAESNPYIYTSIHIPILGSILKVFGTENLFILKLFNQIGNILLLVVTIYLSILIMGKINYKKMFFVILINLIYPSLLILSTISIYRDSWILFYYILALCFLIQYIKNGSNVFNFLFLVTLIPLFLYREYAIIPLIIIYILYHLMKFINLKILLLILFICMNITLIFFRDFEFPVINMSLADALSFREQGVEMMDGGSQLNINLETTNIFNFYANYFYSFISTVFGPFIWQANSISMLMLMVVESIPFLFITYFLLRKIKTMSTSELVIIIASLILFLEVSLINDNLGTATRVRILGWLPLIVLTISKIGEKKNENSF